MLHLSFAPSLDLLSQKILGDIRAVWKDPFLPPTVIVPNPSVGKWLRMRLAANPHDDRTEFDAALPFGCVANCDMATLERFLWDVLQPSPDMRMLDVACFEQVICSLLDEDFLKQDICASLNAYLTTGEGEIDPLKRVQLSARIAHQFLEYEYNRPSVWGETKRTWRKQGTDAAWLAGRTYFGKEAEHEGWQKELYSRAIDCLKADGDDTRYISLPHLYRLRREESAKNTTSWGVVPTGNIFLFGVTRVSHFHRNTLVEISQMDGVDLQVYLTNPCAEFWEDVRTWRHQKVRRVWKHDSDTKDAGIAPRRPDDYNKEELKDITELPRDHALLELWGGAGKENIFLWCPQAQWNFTYHSPKWVESDSGPDSLLRALQYSLLRRGGGLPAHASGQWPDDGSLQVLACPDRGREIEEIREQVLDMVHAGTVTQLNEIAVYLPEPGMYVPYIQRVFGAFRPGEPDHIPFTILGAPGSDSLFAQGMHLFLELIRGRYDRAHVFALLRNPIIQSSRGITPEQVAVWEHWAEELGIYRGYNHEHRKEMGDRGETVTDVHTFELGMARMLIGNLSIGPVTLDYHLLPDGAGEAACSSSSIPPFRDFDTTDHTLLETFCATIEQLYTDTQKFCSAAAAGPSEAIEMLKELVWDWFGDISDETALNCAAEGMVRRDFMDVLPLISMQSELAGRKGIGHEELLALIENCLPAELPIGSAAWTGGITFAPLKPAMVVPHTVIIIAGLDASAFPGTGDRSSWDLLSGKRIVGDSDTVRDNRFAFLESVHAAQKRLVLSFRDQDKQKDEELQPASVVLELEAYLKSQGLKTVAAHGDELCSIRTKVSWIVHESLAEIAATGRQHGSWSAEEVHLAHLSAEGERVAHRHDLSDTTMVQGTGNVLVRTDIHSLRLFYTNPLEYHLSRTLGIEIDEEAGTMNATDEPLESGSLAMALMQRAIWTTVLTLLFPKESENEITRVDALVEEAEKAARRVYYDNIAGGTSPEAQLCHMEMQQLIVWAGQCARTTLRLRDAFADHRLLENSDLSLEREGVLGELIISAAEKGDRTVLCRHQLVLVPRATDSTGGAIGIVRIEKEGPAVDNHTLWLQGVVQMLSEERVSAPMVIRLVQLNRAEVISGAKGIRFADMTAAGDAIERIQGWLDSILDTMLVDRCSDHLPFRVIQNLTKPAKKGDDAGRVSWEKVTTENCADKLSDDHSVYTCYLEAFDLTDARIPDMNNDELQQLARSRFGPMLERWVHNE